MHDDGKFSQEITFRKGKEVVGAQQATASGKVTTPLGLTSTGEFGTLQGVIVLDMVHGKLAWSHWETTGAGEMAVFRYEVPEAQSHYQVDYCCVRHYADSDSYSPVSSNLPNSYHGTPGYHGTLSIDPATGAIMRMTVEASLKNSEPITDGSVAIDYGQVRIEGDKSYICPVHSVAISVVRSEIEGLYAPRAVRRINEVEFTNYHGLGAAERMLVPAASR